VKSKTNVGRFPQDIGQTKSLIEHLSNNVEHFSLDVEPSAPDGKKGCWAFRAEKPNVGMLH
jgi:hypothetical protein